MTLTVVVVQAVTLALAVALSAVGFQIVALILIVAVAQVVTSALAVALSAAHGLNVILIQIAVAMLNAILADVVVRRAHLTLG